MTRNVKYRLLLVSFFLSTKTGGLPDRILRSTPSWFPRHCCRTALFRSATTSLNVFRFLSVSFCLRMRAMTERLHPFRMWTGSWASSIPKRRTGRYIGVPAKNCSKMRPAWLSGKWIMPTSLKSLSWKLPDEEWHKRSSTCMTSYWKVNLPIRYWNFWSVKSWKHCCLCRIDSKFIAIKTIGHRWAASFRCPSPSVRRLPCIRTRTVPISLPLTDLREQARRPFYRRWLPTGSSMPYWSILMIRISS